MTNVTATVTDDGRLELKKYFYEKDLATITSELDAIRMRRIATVMEFELHLAERHAKAYNNNHADFVKRRIRINNKLAKAKQLLDECEKDLRMMTGVAHEQRMISGHDTEQG